MRNYFALKQLWLWKKNNLWLWSETIIFTVLVLLACHLANPKNPLFLHAIFPWPWIAAIIIVLRYGFGPGLVSAVIIAVAAILTGPANAIILATYQNYIFSGFVLTFFCALFSASAVRRMNNAEELLNYSQERLNNLSRSYYVLNASYNYLEQNLILQPTTLRSVMEKLQATLIQQQGKLSPEIASRFLELVCQHCSVTKAGIYLAESNKLLSTAIAEVGLMEALANDDPIVIASMKASDICYVSINQLENMEETRYLVAAPMRNSDGKLVAVLLIKEISFKTLTIATLRILSILTNYFIAQIAVTSTMADFLTRHPHCPPQFAQALKKLLLLKQRMNIDSALVAVLVTKNLQPHNVIYLLQQQQRSLDSSWIYQLDHFDVIVTLMPLTDAAGIQGYLNRITDYLKSHLGLAIDQQNIKSRSLQLTASSPTEMIQQFLTYVEGAAS